MDQKPFMPAPGVFPISLPKTIRLIITLLYLQLLYAASYLALPLRNSRREFPPFNNTIVRIETRVTTAILGIAPLPVYNSATATERPWQLASGNGLLNQDTNICTVLPGPSSRDIPIWPTQAQHDSDSSDEQQSPILNLQENITQMASLAHRDSSSIYDTVHRIRSSTRGSISTIASSAKAIFRQPLNMVSRNLDGSPEERHDVRHEPELVIQAPVSTPEPGFIENVPFPVPKTAPISVARAGDHFSDPGPESAIKAQQAVSFGAKNDPVVDVDTVQMNRSRKYHSIESYPGKFPVSDSLDYSSLATAYAVRGRGTTSVRPFSDY
ncbi:hypothetical protein N7457_007355 [Penicillium paradoxum]|uniref:uncharacterized protein n=1 Tax=Penicillium paradoxum TaxID=176176 RepID=UPI00254996C7|nr:uncharacterized protein N7457_007355 [Penicillium paradoxum]KAJ5779635.1 hypothetical protein N7457_007355 [Penicillium paradoxum]